MKVSDQNLLFDKVNLANKRGQQLYTTYSNYITQIINYSTSLHPTPPGAWTAKCAAQRITLKYPVPSKYASPAPPGPLSLPLTASHIKKRCTKMSLVLSASPRLRLGRPLWVTMFKMRTGTGTKLPSVFSWRQWRAQNHWVLKGQSCGVCLGIPSNNICHRFTHEKKIRFEETLSRTW